MEISINDNSENLRSTPKFAKTPDAKKRIEATNDGHGYHVDGHTFYSMETYWLRKVVAAIANANAAPASTARLRRERASGLNRA